MSAIRILRQRCLRLNNVQRLMSGGGHGPMTPPFARLAPFTEQLPEEIELVWDDSVAPEACLDFDAPHVSTSEVFKMFFGAFGFFGLIYGLVVLSDPVGSNPVALRSTVMPPNTNEMFLAMDLVGESSSEDDEEEEEED